MALTLRNVPADLYFVLKIFPSLSEYTPLTAPQCVRCLRWRYNRVRLYVTVAGSRRMITDSLMSSTVQYSTAQYSTIQYSTAQHSTAQYSPVQYSTVRYSKAQYSTVQYSPVQYGTVQHSTVRYSTVQCCAHEVCFHRQRLSHVHGNLLRGFLCTILSSDVYCLKS